MKHSLDENVKWQIITKKSQIEQKSSEIADKSDELIQEIVEFNAGFFPILDSEKFFKSKILELRRVFQRLHIERDHLMNQLKQLETLRDNLNSDEFRANIEAQIKNILEFDDQERP